VLAGNPALHYSAAFLVTFQILLWLSTLAKLSFQASFIILTISDFLISKGKPESFLPHPSRRRKVVVPVGQ